MYLISACLLGENCKYNGGNNRSDVVLAFARAHQVLAVCPETAGGLPAPREPSEQRGSRVFSRAGKDVTDAFRTGAAEELARAEQEAARRGEALEGAVLKARSPSCGVGTVYDGTFTGTTCPGDGCFAQLLRARGVPMRTEEDLAAAAAGEPAEEKEDREKAADPGNRSAGKQERKR